MRKPNVPEDVLKSLVLQNIFKKPQDNAIRNLALGILVIIESCQNCLVKIEDKDVDIYLLPYDGFKGFWQKLMKKRLFNTVITDKLTRYWLSYLGEITIKYTWVTRKEYEEIKTFYENKAN